MQQVYNDGYEAGLRAAALQAERVRDAKYMLAKREEAAGAEEVRVRIQVLIDYGEVTP